MTGLPNKQTEIKNIVTYNDGVLVCLRSDPLSQGVPLGNPRGTQGSPLPSGSYSQAESCPIWVARLIRRTKSEIFLVVRYSLLTALDARGISPPNVHTNHDKLSHIYTMK